MGGIIVVAQPEDAMDIANAYLAKVDESKGNLLLAKGLLEKFMKEFESGSRSGAVAGSRSDY